MEVRGKKLLLVVLLAALSLALVMMATDSASAGTMAKRSNELQHRQRPEAASPSHNNGSTPKSKAVSAPRLGKTGPSPANETNEFRKQRIRDVCARFRKLPRRISMRMRSLTTQWTLVDDRRKSLYCTISKASSSTLKYMLLKTTGPKIPTDYFNSHDVPLLERQGLKFLWSYTTEEADFKLKNYYKYLVVRNPFERLVSAHRDKFLQKDERYYTSDLGRTIKRYRIGSKDTKVEFWEFIKYILEDNSNPLSYDRHWIPQFYVCDPCNVQYDYVAKVETFQRDVQAIFRHLNITWSSWQYLPRRNTHGRGKRKSLEEMYSSISSSDLQKLLDIYQIDMDVFGYVEPWLEARLLEDIDYT